MNSKHYLNEMWQFICSKALEDEFYNTLSTSDKTEIKKYLKVE